MEFKRINTVAINAFGIMGSIACFDQNGEQILELNREKDEDGFWMDRIKTYWVDSNTEFIDMKDYEPKYPF